MSPGSAAALAEYWSDILDVVDRVLLADCVSDEKEDNDGRARIGVDRVRIGAEERRGRRREILADVRIAVVAAIFGTWKMIMDGRGSRNRVRLDVRNGLSIVVKGR